jgi:chromosome segregation ATPase
MAEWDTLARGLEAKLARMLPCDPRAAEALDQVKRASDARLSAISRYLESAAAQAKADVEKSRKALAEEETATKESEVERTEAEQLRAAIDGQLADLTESIKRRAALDDARQKLNEIRARVEQRIDNNQQQSQRHAALAASLRDLVTVYEAQQKAVADNISALAVETARWNEYYTARITRAQTECSITNQRPTQRKKQ